MCISHGTVITWKGPGKALLVQPWRLVCGEKEGLCVPMLPLNLGFHKVWGLCNRWFADMSILGNTILMCSLAHCCTPELLNQPLFLIHRSCWHNLFCLQNHVTICLVYSCFTLLCLHFGNIMFLFFWRPLYIALPLLDRLDPPQLNSWIREFRSEPDVRFSWGYPTQRLRLPNRRSQQHLWSLGAVDNFQLLSYSWKHNGSVIFEVRNVLPT